jgi:hypothetical protein
MPENESDAQQHHRLRRACDRSRDRAGGVWGLELDVEFADRLQPADYGGQPDHDDAELVGHNHDIHRGLRDDDCDHQRWASRLPRC